MRPLPTVPRQPTTSPTPFAACCAPPGHLPRRATATCRPSLRTPPPPAKHPPQSDPPKRFCYAPLLDPAKNYGL